MHSVDHSEPVVVAVVGELNLGNAHELGDKVDAAMETGADVRLDLALCEFIDSTGLAVLVRKGRELREEGRQLTVANVPWDVERIFEISGLFVEGSPVARATI
jgi:anti-anti-sigma factor